MWPFGKITRAFAAVMPITIANSYQHFMLASRVSPHQNRPIVTYRGSSVRLSGERLISSKRWFLLPVDIGQASAGTIQSGIVTR